MTGDVGGGDPGVTTMMEELKAAWGGRKEEVKEVKTSWDEIKQNQRGEEQRFDKGCRAYDKLAMSMKGRMLPGQEGGGGPQCAGVATISPPLCCRAVRHCHDPLSNYTHHLCGIKISGA